MSKYLYGISKQKARENFVHYLSNDYFCFLDKLEYLDEECYEMYIDDIFDDDDDDVSKISCHYICFFDGKRLEFDSILESSEWLNSCSGGYYSLYYTFYTHHDFEKALNSCVNSYDGNLNSYYMLFRDYLFLECDLNNVDLCDFDYIFGFLRLQERLTSYHGLDCYVNGYNVFHVSIRKDKE